MAHKHYYLSLQQNQQTTMPNASLLYSGTVKDDPDWLNIPHKHDFCEILLVVHGQGRVTLDGTEYAVKQHDLIIVNPNVLHEERSNPDDPLNLFFVAVQKFQIGDFAPNMLAAPGACPIVNTEKYQYKLESIFTEIIQETANMVTFYAEMTKCLVDTLLLLIMRILLVDTDEKEVSDECKKVQSYIDKHYSSPITLEELSERVYISKHHLAHLFKEQMGTSPIQYMIQKRIEEAARLLVETDYSVSQIAAKVGYNDTVYFSQIFKRTHNMAPLAYRKKRRKV